MARLPWQPGGGGYSNAWDGGDVEALQTDVMRFIAILGLCLMAIFAIVQSLPLTPADPRPRLESPEQLKEQIRLLSERAQRLRAELAGLQMLLQQAHQATERAKLRLERVQERLAQSGRSLSDRQARLEELERAVDARQGSLTDVRHKLSAERRRLETVRRQLTRARSQLVQPRPETQSLDKLPEPVKPAQPPTSTPARPTQREGFSLRFVSDEAFKTLLRQRRVALYAKSGSTFWSVAAQGAGWRVALSDPPARYHEMARSTVPEEFVNALRRQVSAHERNAVLWAVTLPSTLVVEVKRVMGRHKGGDLVIREDGSLVLEH